MPERNINIEPLVPGDFRYDRLRHDEVLENLIGKIPRENMYFLTRQQSEDLKNNSFVDPDLSVFQQEFDFNPKDGRLQSFYIPSFIPESPNKKKIKAHYQKFADHVAGVTGLDIKPPAAVFMQPPGFSTSVLTVAREMIHLRQEKDRIYADTASRANQEAELYAIATFWKLTGGKRNVFDYVRVRWEKYGLSDGDISRMVLQKEQIPDEETATGRFLKMVPPGTTIRDDEGRPRDIHQELEGRPRFPVLKYPLVNNSYNLFNRFLEALPAEIKGNSERGIKPDPSKLTLSRMMVIRGQILSTENLRRAA